MPRFARRPVRAILAARTGYLIGGPSMKTEPAVSGVTAPEAVDTRGSDTRLMRSLLIGIFMFMAIYALYFAREFFMPVVLAFLLALMLTPIVRFLKKRGIPEAHIGHAAGARGGGRHRRHGLFRQRAGDEPRQRRAGDRPEAHRAARRTAPPLRADAADFQAGRAGRRHHAGAGRAEGRHGAAGHHLAGRRQSSVGIDDGRHHLRAVAVPDGVGHHVLREDHPVLRAA